MLIIIISNRYDILFRVDIAFSHCVRIKLALFMKNDAAKAKGTLILVYTYANERIRQTGGGRNYSVSSTAVG